MNEGDVSDFWQAHPCGEDFVGGADRFRDDCVAFFDDYDAFRYQKEPHILECLAGIDFRGKRVLEIGTGQGADAEQIVRMGGEWFGVDLTTESPRRVMTRFGVRDISTGGATTGSAVSLPFADASFDIVFSHGVLHHIPEINRAQSEIRRVLKPDGELIAMLYAKNSINYLVSIAMLRRAALAVAYVLPKAGKGIVGEHVANARKTGLFNYLRMENFIHRNTDGPGNPYSKVYDRRTVERDFADFEIVRTYKRFMHAPPLPVGKLPLERSLGWHLWVHMRPRVRND